VLAGIIGIVLAWLLTASRRQEIALLRALGTPPGRIAVNFFTEQAFLCAMGLLLGLGLWRVSGHGFTQMQQLLTGAFFGCWCCAVLCRLLPGLGKRAEVSLSEPE